MKRILDKAIMPIRFFFNDSRSTGVLLIFCTLVSLLLSNSSAGNHYRSFWEMNVSHLPMLPKSIEKWINDCLMAIFFLLAGMEIKRELLDGELSSFKKAVLPFGAALGGMVFPALIYLLFTHGTGQASGWGIPTATDIAFSVGIASLLGKRIPVGLKIFLLALAIIDDLGAIAIITFFYGGKINLVFLAVAAVIYVALLACNYFKFKFGWLQILLSVALWFAVFNSGIEAGITGVLIALALPLGVIPVVEKAIHKKVNFIILPLFALANTAILLPGNIGEALKSSVGMGVLAGLVLGKPAGIFLFSRLLVFLKVASLPSRVSWAQVLGMGTLAGIGFTMSIFTTSLAFSDKAAMGISKIAIIAALIVSVVISVSYFWMLDVVASTKKEVAERKANMELALDAA